MFRYLFITARKSKLFLTSTLLLSLLLSALPVTLTSIQSTKVQTEKSIATLGRGSYDILVRPHSARTDVEVQNGLVEENYLSGGLGGITLEQYQSILKIEDVEAAAPVAVVGFFTNSTGGVSFTLPRPADKPTVTTIELSSQTGLGREYLDFATTYAVQLPNQPGVMTNISSSSRTLDGKTQLMIELPAIYHLIVGVDPVQEAKLLGKSGFFLHKLPSGITYKKQVGTDKRLPRLPLLYNADLDSRFTFTVKTQEILRPTDQFVKELATIEPYRLPEIIKGDLMAPVRELQSVTLGPLMPFEEPMFEVSADNQVTVPTDYRTSSTSNNSTYYLSERLQYALLDQKQSLYSLIPDTSSSTSRYRKLSQKGNANFLQPTETLFLPSLIDSFKSSDITVTAYDPSPLGIYSFSPVVQVRDQDGNAVHSELKKNFTPDTFLPIQPAGLTNLETAAWLKGESPIDAVRVRVAGISGYDKYSEQKVFKVANDIKQATGLHLDIVAGASKQNVLVEVPAVGKNPAVGVVQEVWTSLGAALKITSAINNMSLVTMIGLFLIVIVYTIVHTQTQFIVRHHEFSVLRAIGWRKQDIRKLMLTEWCFKTLLAFLLANGILLLLQPVIGLGGYWPLVLTFQAAMLICLLITVFLTVNRLQENRIHLGRSVEWSGKSRFSLNSIRSAALSNFIGQWKYNFLNVTLFAITGAVAIFTANMIFSVQNKIETTFLGVAVNSATASSQWLVVLGTLAVTLFGIWEAARAMAAKREKEVYILRMIGWSEQHVASLIGGELALILGAGLGLALLFGLALFRIFYLEFPISVWAQCAGTIALFVLVTRFSIRLINRYTKKVS